MPKTNHALKDRPILDGFQEATAGVDTTRQERLRMWMRREGITLKMVSEWWDCHFSLPGKILVAELEPLNDERRADLLSRGFPPETLPAPWTKEQRQETNKQLVVYREATRKKKRIDRIKEARAKRVSTTTQRLVL